ncbi:MAG: MFS transporter [SAR324 cluster bacterium]|nr:MFS transporter [SAR324 cluster bacterium]
MTMAKKLPFSKQIAYAIGQLGWSILINVVNLQLVYFYIPPSGSGLKTFIPQVVFLAVLNALTLLAASGRLFDAITDPLIASLSDNWKGPNGRRMPFLKVGAIPAALCCLLMFIPVIQEESGWNIAWLFLTQILFYLFLTVYVTPYFALLPELGHSARQRLNLSTWISITYALGIMLAAQIPVLASVMKAWGITNPVTAIQWAIGLITMLAALLMLVPPLMIDEREYCLGAPANIPVFQALKQTFRNKHFIYYVVADFSYFMGLTIVMTGLLYYITVLLGLNESLMGILLPLMVVISFLFYPVVNILAQKTGKKILITGSFLFMSGTFFFIFFFGKLPIPNLLQAYLVVILYSVPLAFLGVLPNAVLADIAEHDALKTGIRQEGMYFAARTLMQKFGQTFGVLIFAGLTSLGKDPGDDLGIRLSGLVGFGLCLSAGLFFWKYQEDLLLRETEMFEADMEGDQV